MEVSHVLNKYVVMLDYEWNADTPLRGALMILLGGGASKKQIADGASKLEYFRKRWANDYVDQLAAAGLGERRGEVNRSIKQYLSEPEEAAAAAA